MHIALTPITRPATLDRSAGVLEYTSLQMSLLNKNNACCTQQIHKLKLAYNGLFINKRLKTSVKHVKYDILCVDVNLEINGFKNLTNIQIFNSEPISCNGDLQKTSNTNDNRTFATRIARVRHLYISFLYIIFFLIQAQCRIRLFGITIPLIRITKNFLV